MVNPMAKAKTQKAFWKCECGLIDRFIDDLELLLYFKMRCLADREGRIPMDTSALAARIRWPEAQLVSPLARLMEPNPESRCQTADGRCVAYIDPKRPELGFWIPAVPRHRKRHADTERRRAYKAGKMREYRAKTRGQRVDTRGQRVDNGGPPLPSKVDNGGHRVDTAWTKVDREGDIEREKYMNSKNGGTTRSPVGAPIFDLLSGPPEDEIHNVDQIVRFFCETIFKGGLRPNQIAQKTLQRLVEQLPLTRQQLSNLDDLFNWPDEDVRLFPELKDRKPVGLSYLIDNLGDYLTKSAQFVKHFDR